MGQITKNTIAMIRKCVEQGSPPPLTAWEYEQLCRFAEAAIAAPTSPAEQQGEQEPVAYCRQDTVLNWKGQVMNVAMMFPSPIGLDHPIPLYIHPSPSLAELRAKVEALKPHHVGVSEIINKEDVLALLGEKE